MNILIVGLLADACDTTSNLDDPNDSFFVKFYGGDGDQTGEDVVALSDGTFILFGTSKPSGAEKTSQWYFVRADAKGNVIWEKRFGGPNNDEARDLELAQGNTLVADGNTYTTPTDRDIMIMTLTLDGAKIDSATVNLGTAGTDEDAVSVSVISNGFIIAGSTSNTSLKAGSLANDQRDAVHLRFTPALVEYPNSWAKAYGPGTVDAATRVYEVSPTQFYVFGYSNKTVAGQATVNQNFWVYGISQFGSPNSNEYTIGDPTSDDVLTSVSVKVTPSSTDYFISGITYGASATRPSDVYIAKLREPLFPSLTTLPPPLFQKPLSIKLGSSLPDNTAIFTTQDGGFLLLTNEKSFNDNQNWMLTKVDTFGSPVWTLPIIFGGEGLDTCGSVQELPDGRIILIGTMRTGKPDAGEFKMTLVKVNQEGKFAN
ncbi:MAG TPA: hypothetical protein VG737_15255 [Cyclobacteriaceae bacterium]|nr:hypothetical protein [Cyclobacteriaceae bacterium]